MNKKSNSKALSAPSKANSLRPTRDTRFGRELIAAASEILAHRRGEIKLETYSLPGTVNVKSIRNKTELSQTQFARRFGFNVRTLQQWETGRAAPPPPVRAYLTVIERDRKAVEKALDAA